MAYSSLWTTSASVGLTMAKLSRIVPSCGTEGVWRRNQSHPISVKTLRLLLPFTDMSKCISSLCCRGEESWPAASKTGVEDPRSKHSEANCSSHLLLSSLGLSSRASLQQCNSCWNRASLLLGPIQIIQPIPNLFLVPLCNFSFFCCWEQVWVHGLSNSGAAKNIGRQNCRPFPCTGVRSVWDGASLWSQIKQICM